ncbi:hypothetical protein JW872_01315 [Candidatus Babeliales bacterium]|nr:hypothetical protein [Candidatus Babeliales bacterium]
MNRQYVAKSTSFVTAAIFLLSCMTSTVSAFFPINIFQPYDQNTYRQYRWKDLKFATGLTGEFGYHTVGRSEVTTSDDRTKSSSETDVLQIWECEQNALAMLKGLPSSTNLGSFAQLANIDDDDGVRGHIVLTGDLSMQANVPFHFRWYLPHGFIFGAYLPVLSMKLDDISIIDRTQSITAEDLLVKSVLTNNIVANVRALTGIKLCGWEQVGIGDLSFMMDWQRNYPQAKELLKNVRPRLRVGLTLPTGKKTDEDELLSVPFGNDGSFGVVFGGGLDLTLGYKLKVGADAEFLNLFNNMRERRIKTYNTQTEHLFPVKVGVLKDYGFTERFNLYLEFFEVVKGLTLRGTYQYYQHHEDELKVIGNQYSSIIANTSQRFEEWTMHNVILNLNYDFRHIVSDDSWFKPYIAFFYKKGTNGKNCVLTDTFGFTFSLSF